MMTHTAQTVQLLCATHEVTCNTEKTAHDPGLESHRKAKSLTFFFSPLVHMPWAWGKSYVFLVISVLHSLSVHAVPSFTLSGLWGSPFFLFSPFVASVEVLSIYAIPYFSFVKNALCMDAGEVVSFILCEVRGSLLA